MRQDAIAGSKIPVREALFQLEKDGLVEIRPNRGAVVRGFSTAEILGLMDIRLALECRSLELAISNKITTDFESMKALLDDYQAIPEMLEWGDLNQRLNFMLYEPCGNKQLLAMISAIQRRLGKYFRLMMTEASDRERPMAEHLQIMEFCREAKADEALECLRTHIDTTKKNSLHSCDGAHNVNASCSKSREYLARFVQIPRL